VGSAATDVRFRTLIVRDADYGPAMEMLTGEQITKAELSDWRKLGQGLHARYVVGDFGAAVRFVAAVGQAGDAVGHYPRVTIGAGYVDLKLLSDDAVYRDSEGREHVVEWVTDKDVELARRISQIAAEQAVAADPASITAVELALDTAHAATIAPVWAALLTGSTDARGRGTIGDDVRDATGRVPILWFQDTDEHETPRQRFHLDVQVPYDVAERRIAAALAAGAVIVDDSRAPWTTILADQDGNKACVGTMQPPAHER
jgi:4a-hydroxytetrahydrobiopterin dehydratase